jgi:hypothetical protein
MNIPKICHLYWDGSPMSWLQTVTVKSFHRYNPDWRIIVYMPEKIYNGNQLFVPKYTGKDYFNIVKELDYVEFQTINLNTFGIDENLHDILRSDILRYKLLYEFGGVWSDFDVIWLKPIEHLSNISYLDKIAVKYASDFICMYEQFSGHHNISVMIHEKNSDFIQSLISKTTEIQSTLNHITLDHQTFGTVMLNKLYPLFLNIKEKFPRAEALKYNAIFPYSIFKMDELYIKLELSNINNDVLCVHWFFGHQFSKEYTHKDLQFHNYSCSMNGILRAENYIP